MAKVTFHFRAYAVDEAANWNPPPALAGAPVFGVYLIAEDEATHLCSFTPSSRADFLRNTFLTKYARDPEAAQAYLDRDGSLEYENEEPTTYLGFVDVSAPSNAPYLSERLSITLDTRDDDGWDQDAYDAQKAKSARFNVSPQQAAADARRAAMRDAAWEAALEEMNSNHRDPPILMDAALYEAHRLRRALSAARAAERDGSTAPLLAHAGVAAPLALRA